MIIPLKRLDEQIAKNIIDIFSNRLVHPVDIIYFSLQEGCYTCEEIELLLTELTSTSPKLHFSVYDLNHDQERARQYQVELAPTLIVTGRDGDVLLDYGVRFVGAPSGYEFSSLIQAILMVSKRASALSPETCQKLTNLSKPVHLKVFVTPT